MIQRSSKAEQNHQILSCVCEFVHKDTVSLHILTLDYTEICASAFKCYWMELQAVSNTELAPFHSFQRFLGMDLNMGETAECLMS